MQPRTRAEGKTTPLNQKNVRLSGVRISILRIYFGGVQISNLFCRVDLFSGFEVRCSIFIFGELFSGCSNFEFMLMTNHESRIPAPVFFVLRNFLTDVWAI